MTKISRITANISPGPFNRMMGLTTEQVAMIHGTTPFPTTTSKRPSHPKAGILRALVQSIGEDIGRVSEGRPAIVGLLFGSDELNQIHLLASNEKEPFHWLARDYSREFFLSFLGTLLSDPLLLCVLAQVACHTRIGSLFTSVQGFPGSGKTHIMVLVAMILAVSLDAQILWTTKGNEALKSAAKLFDKLCGRQENVRVARLLARNIVAEPSVDVIFDMRIGEISR